MTNYHSSDLERIEKKLDELLAREPTIDALYSRTQFCKLIGIGWRKLVMLKAKYNLPIGSVTRENGVNPKFSQADVKAMNEWKLRNL